MADDIIGVLIIGIVMLVPIITILTKHQQKMAELFREERVQLRSEPETEALRKELADVKALLYEQSIALDNLARNQTSPGLSDRLEEKPRNEID